MAETPARKLAVILHADVVGSTNLVQRDETLSHTRIQDVFHRFSETIGSYNGHPLELRGDALVAEFNRASDAVEASLAFQAENTRFNSTLEDDIQPTLRIGISLGEVVVADNTITGEGIVLAQRLEQLASAGGVCIQGAVHEAVPGRLPFEYESLGEQELKGFSEPVRAYAVSLKSGEAIPVPEVPAMPGEALPEPPKHRSIVTAGMALLVIVGGGLAWYQPWVSREEPASIERMAFPLPDKPSIAVLPFTNMSNDAQQEYFVDGMTEDLITDLSKLSGLFVIARNSVFTYKDKPVKVREVAEELGVRYMLEGSVRRAGDQVRINAQLIDATTGGHLWAERYDRKLIDVFALQDEIVENIVSALAVALTPSEQLTLTRKYTDSLIAYDHFLRGTEYYFRGTKEENLFSRESFHQAVEIDVGFARAHGMLARTHLRDFANGWSDSRERSLATGNELANKAVSLDESLPQAHFAVASAARYNKKLAIAVIAIEKAIRLDPNYADGFAFLAQILQFGGRPKEALESLDKAVRLNPRHSFLYLIIRGQTNFTLGRYDRAIEAFEQSVERNPSSQRARMWLVTSYAKAGRIEDAEWEADELLTIAPDFSVTRIGEAIPYRDPTHLARFLDGLKEAGLPD